MHFIAAATLVGSALASNVYYETTAYHTTAYAGKTDVYSSVSTCTEKGGKYATPSAKPYGAYSSSAAPVYHTTKPAYYSAPAEVTYTSYTHITVTSCEAYVTDCPAKTYSSAMYSVSTCTEGSYEHPTPAPYSSAVPYYYPPSNTTTCTTDTYATPTPYAPYVPPSGHPVPTYTNTYYTTVCPGGSGCYGTTVTSTYCPTGTPGYTHPAPVYTPPVYTPPAVSSPCPTANATATYVPPPSYTGAASSTKASFVFGAVAAAVALFIAA